MPWLALTLLTVFLVVVFPVRSAIRRRRFGGSGGPDWQAGRPRRWLAADVMFLSSFALLVTGPALEGLDVIEPLFAPGPALAVICVLLVALSTALAVWAQEVMGSAWRPDMPPEAKATLATTGPFRVVRNPNYVAMLAAGLGAAALAPNLVTIAAWLLAAGSLMLTARIEEPLLAARYGAAYARYAARVGRFLPAVGKLTPPREDRPR